VIFAALTLGYAFYAVDRNARRDTDVKVAHAFANAYNTGASQIWRAQIATCERINDRGELVKKESDSRIKSHREENRILAGFLSQAERARRAAYMTDGHDSDLQAAIQYARLRARLMNVKYKILPLHRSNCRRSIPRPRLISP
jgi:hypothetical protein